MYRQKKKKIPGELFFNLQGFMWVEFHSKAHGIWWMSWKIIKKKKRHENCSKHHCLRYSEGTASYKVHMKISFEELGRESNKTNTYYICLWEELNKWQRLKHMQNTDSPCKAIYTWFCTSQGLLLDPSSMKNIWTALLSIFLLFVFSFLLSFWQMINRKHLCLITMRYEGIMNNCYSR